MTIVIHVRELVILSVVTFTLGILVASYTQKWINPYLTNNKQRLVRIIQVEKEHWKVGSLASSLVDRKNPIVLTGTPATQWDAMSWTPEIFFGDDIKEAINVKISPGSDVLYETSGKPFANHPELPWSSGFTVQNMSSTDFLSQLRNSSSYLYYTSNIADMPSRVLKALAPSEPFILSRKKIINDEDSSPYLAATISVWIGSSGVTATTHHDDTNNCFIQVRGRKRWTLAPPESVLGVHLFPMVHPSERQSMAINLRTASNDTYPGVAHVPLFETILEPGEMLYVPPLWFHHVETLDSSISVNFWSKDESSIAFEGVLADGVTFFVESWPLSRMLYYVREFVWMLGENLITPLVSLRPLARSVDGEFSIRSFLRTYVRRTWREHLRLSSVNSFECPKWGEDFESVDVDAVRSFLQPHLVMLMKRFESIHLELRPIYYLRFLETLFTKLVGAYTVAGYMRKCFLYEDILYVTSL